MITPKIFLTILCFILLLTPFLASAQITLNVDYPVTEGGGGISGDSTLPQVAKYVFNWAIIIALIVAAISLMYGGSLYLSAAGRPDMMTQAKKQIFGSALGLFILFGSFLFLKLTNPTLTILRVKKTAVNTGIILLDEKAMGKIPSNFGSDLSKDGVEKMKQTLQTFLEAPADGSEGRALYLGFSRPNLETWLGKIKNEAGVESFSNGFDLGGIYFLPGSNFKVTVYSGESYKSQLKTDEGILSWSYPQCSIDPCPFIFGSQTDALAEITKKMPRSIKVEGIGRGVYLSYQSSLANQVNKDVVWNEEHYFQSSIDDLDYVNFNDKANQIEIRNWEQVYTEDFTNPDNSKWEWRAFSNYLAILHEEKYNRGSLRIFFEQNINFPHLETENVPGNLPAGYQSSSPGINNAFLSLASGPLAKVDSYGKVDKPSSIEVFRMDPGQKCKVKLCYGYNMTGNCMVYDSAMNKKPFYVPANLPGKDDDKNDDGIVDDSEKFEIAKAVRSMSIDGYCTVVLFENSIKDADACIKCNNPDNPSETACNGCWDKGGPGARSTVFTSPSGKAEYPEMDLYPIGTCAGLGNFLANKLWRITNEYDSCASAIAIYPIENPRQQQ